MAVRCKTNYIFTAIPNLVHEESHLETHVYLTVVHYGAISNHLALSITVYAAALTRQCSQCIIQMTTRRLITEKKHIFTKNALDLEASNWRSKEYKKKKKKIYNY